MWDMDAKELFFERYRGFQEYPAILLDGMTEQQLRGRSSSRSQPNRLDSVAHSPL